MKSRHETTRNGGNITGGILLLEAISVGRKLTMVRNGEEKWRFMGERKFMK